MYTKFFYLLFFNLIFARFFILFLVTYHLYKTTTLGNGFADKCFANRNKYVKPLTHDLYFMYMPYVLGQFDVKIRMAQKTPRHSIWSSLFESSTAVFNLFPYPLSFFNFSLFFSSSVHPHFVLSALWLLVFLR